MSIWTNKPARPRRALGLWRGRFGWPAGGLWAALAVGLAVGLAGCGPLGGGNGGGLAAPLRLGPEGPLIAGPAGFCIDAEASRPGRAAPTILLLPCAMLAPAGPPGAPAAAAPVAFGPQPLLSVTLSAEGAGTPSAEALALWAGTRRGRAALSRSGRAETVSLTQTRLEDGVAYLALTDTAAFPGAAVAPDYWRALFVLGGRVASASVYLPADADPAARAARGEALQAALVASLRAVNRP